MLRNKQEIFKNRHPSGTLNLPPYASTSRQETFARMQSADFHMANNCMLLPHISRRRTGKSQTEVDANQPVNEAHSEKIRKRLINEKSCRKMY